MAHIDILSDSKFPVDRKAIRERVDSVLKRQGIGDDVSVSIKIVGDRKMRQINREYRDKDYSTDVLSFPTIDPSQPIQDSGFFDAPEFGRHLGDILVSHPQAVMIASRKNEMLSESIGDLVEHGMMHLLGYHHD